MNTLKDDLRNLRINFHLKLAKKRMLNVTKPEITELVDNMKDEEIQAQIEKPKRIRKWFKFFRS